MFWSKNSSYYSTNFIRLSNYSNCMDHNHHYLHYLSFSFSIVQLKTNSFYYPACRCHSSRKWQQAIIVCFVCCINTVILLSRYMVLINILNIINFLLEHNIYRIHCYNSRKGKLIFCLGKNVFLQFDWFYFSIYLKSLY